MNTVQQLISEVSEARIKFIETINELPEEKAIWKPAPEVWNIIEITEHLYWAELGGVLGMWKTLPLIRDGKIERTDESIYKNLPIEDIIAKTWQLKEIVPKSAEPRFGGSLNFWKNAFSSLQLILNEFGLDLKDDELRLQAQPHPISGPLDFHQRFEFLRFHIYRHKDQVSNLLETKS